MKISRIVATAGAFISVWIAIIGSAAMNVAYAQNAHEIIRPSLVYLEATAKGASGPQTGVPVNTSATGFLVSTDGLILTVYHLISKLGDVVPETVEIVAKIESKNEKEWRAAIVDASIHTDLLLLKIPPSSKDFPKVLLGNAQNHKDTEAIYTSGFPVSLSYIKDDDKIKVREGPGGYLWTTGFKFEAGQSGSPIYNLAGEVIGVVKGDVRNLSYIIPIEFADSLLAQIRLHEFQNKLNEMVKQIETLKSELHQP